MSQVDILDGTTLGSVAYELIEGVKKGTVSNGRFVGRVGGWSLYVYV